MAADIVEAAHLAVGTAQAHELFAEYVERVVVARLRQIVHMADEVPGAREQMLPLGLEEVSVVIKPGRQALFLCAVHTYPQ